MKKVLSRGIDFGGDSMSDYRNIEGKRRKFQEKHLVYLRTGQKCLSAQAGKSPLRDYTSRGTAKNCKGIIVKQKIAGRSAHYCPICQK